MKVFILILISTSSFAQIIFEKGYLIDNSGNKKECLIKNVDWEDNPTKFIYKMEGNDSLKKGDIESVAEFCVYGYYKFVRANVKIDRSEVLLSDLGYDKNPAWSDEKLFLKVLIESKASLYSYKNHYLTRFFYSVNKSPISQLVYKQYRVGESTLGENNYFKQQLWLFVRCKNTTMNSLTNLRCIEKDLKKYFDGFNKCEGETIEIVKTKTKRNSINFKITPGLNYSSLSFSNPIYFSQSVAFNNTLNFRLGFEFEYILPFRKNKWSFVFEPTFQTLHTENAQVAKIDYSFLEFPMGLRHYFFLANNSKIFLNGLLILPYTYNFKGTRIDFINSPESLDIKSDVSFACGFGYELNRMSLETRYYGSKDILANYPLWSSDYKRFSLILGYKIFRTKKKV